MMNDEHINELIALLRNKLYTLDSYPKGGTVVDLDAKDADLYLKDGIYFKREENKLFAPRTTIKKDEELYYSGKYFYTKPGKPFIEPTTQMKAIPMFIINWKEIKSIDELNSSEYYQKVEHNFYYE